MATTVLEHTYKLKGGNEDAVYNNNPLLERREPVVVFMEDGSTKMKIGDGVNRYRDLPWLGEQEIFCAKTRNQFPNIGREDMLYKAEEEGMLYQWNTTKLIYEVLGPEQGEVDINISLISGGTAKDLLQ